MKFDTNCEAHTWPKPKDGWCPICIMNESDDVKRQRDKIREALCRISAHTADGVKAREIARAALKEIDNG